MRCFVSHFLDLLGHSETSFRPRAKRFEGHCPTPPKYARVQHTTWLCAVGERISTFVRPRWYTSFIFVLFHTCQFNIVTTSQPNYLQDLISLQTDNNTRSSDVVTLARPSAASSLKITDRSFQYASPHLWNKLPSSLREPVSPLRAYLNPSFSSPLSPSMTPSLFHSTRKLKTYLSRKSFLP